MSAPSDLGSSDVLAFCAARGVSARLHTLSVETRTVADAAAALGADTDAIVKSLVFMAAGEPVLVVAAGTARVNYPLVAAALGLSRRAVRFAGADEALEITGFPVGGMPPFGHRAKLRTLLDATTVPRSGTVFAGGGTLESLIELAAATLPAACDGVWAPLTKPPEAGVDRLP